MAKNTFPDAPIILWFRDDLRLRDNAALIAVAQSGLPVIPVFIFETDDNKVPYGGAQKWWLHHSLASLAASLENHGQKLILRRGQSRKVLDTLIEETGARCVVWNRRYCRFGIDNDCEIKKDLIQRGITATSYGGRLMHEPTQVKTGSGGPYRVYTPFWKAFSASVTPRAPLASPKSIQAPANWPTSDTLDAWALLPTNPDWAGGLREDWQPGEDGAVAKLDRFLDDAVGNYDTDRDFPAVEGTSKLSPHLAFGEISPAQIWARIDHIADQHPSADVTTFRKELVWREFAYHLLVNFTDLKTNNYNSQFDQFPWADSAEHLKAWQRGMTGYPIVDAGMRQLYATGWMHNRVRMIVGSFLVKHLLLDWRYGELWFWDTLVDADPASNTASWQWVAGSGADAAPYFRIFNPITQGEKFDVDGVYVKKWVPELEGLPAKFIHKPWEAPSNLLATAGIKLGETYPDPIVDHKKARERALDAYQQMRGLAA